MAASGAKYLSQLAGVKTDSSTSGPPVHFEQPQHSNVDQTMRKADPEEIRRYDRLYAQAQLLTSVDFGGIPLLDAGAPAMHPYALTHS